MNRPYGFYMQGGGRESRPYAVVGGMDRKNIDTQILSTALQNFVESGGKTESKL